MPDFNWLKRQYFLVFALTSMLAFALILIFFGVFQERYSVIYSGLRPADASSIVGELGKRKIAYRLSDAGATISVPENQADTVRLAIAGSDLPYKGQVGFELFNKSDMGLTEFAQKINYQRALQGELARTIMTLNEIDSARVHLSLPERSVFAREQGDAKASVTIKTRPGFQLEPDQVSGIQRLVAAAVPDLAAGDVVVLDERGGVVSPPPGEPGNGDAHNRAIVRFYEDRVREAVQRAGYDCDVTIVASAAPISAPPSGLGSSGLSKDAAATATGGVRPGSHGRSVGLQVVVSPKGKVPVAVEDQIIATVRDAIGFDASKGDLVEMAAPAETKLIDRSIRPLAAMQPGQSVVVPLGAPPDWLWGVFGASLATLILGGLWWKSTSRASSEAERVHLAERLAVLLDDYEAGRQNAV